VLSFHQGSKTGVGRQVGGISKLRRVLTILPEVAARGGDNRHAFNAYVTRDKISYAVLCTPIGTFLKALVY
jgi:hypothetical protein